MKQINDFNFSFEKKKFAIPAIISGSNSYKTIYA